MKRFKFTFLQLAALFVLIAGSAVAQNRSEKEAEIRKLLDSKNFTFLAETATPMTGGNIRLNSSNYQVSFYKDSLESFLPYFGVAFRSQYGSTQSPLMFSSADFTYETKTSKRGGKTVTIKINSPDDPDMLTLSVSPSGYSTLQVNSVNRQPISFYGTITSNQKSAN
ncbi:DUF4251 domain-containing protein [Daejeonella lutea]|uniref:DUF4251 domain-containing protein n=1 Tax=Daejeonella lutea TaxID=572036 RepID=A0A1T5A8W4_9SPHI|nr:DUF4251 domain-containing protein [Daejeonella lutea]SKB31441.1 protein of unknown function [Daejeonella lutea]